MSFTRILVIHGSSRREYEPLLSMIHLRSVSPFPLVWPSIRQFIEYTKSRLGSILLNIHNVFEIRERDKNQLVEDGDEEE